jgi:hypothetical protein
MLLEAKSTDRRLTVEKIPLPHYYQTQTQMYVTMDRDTGLPRVRYVGYIQYCSHPELKRVPHSKAPATRSSEPRIRILLVKFSAEAAARIVEASNRYMDRLSAARTEQQASSPATPAPTPRNETLQKRPYPGRGRGRGISKRGRGDGTRGRGRGRGTPSLRTRGRGKGPASRVLGVKFHARIRGL